MKKMNKTFRNSIVGFLTGVAALTTNVSAQSVVPQDYIPWREGAPAFRITEINPTENTWTFQVDREAGDFFQVRSVILYYPTWALSFKDPHDLASQAPIYEWSQILAYVQDQSDSIIYRQSSEDGTVDEYKVKSLLPIASTTSGAWSNQTKPYDIYISVELAERMHWAGIVSFADCMETWQDGMTCKMDDGYIETESHYYYSTYHAEVIPEESAEDEQPSGGDEEGSNETEAEKAPEENNNDSDKASDEKAPEKEMTKAPATENRPAAEIRYIRDLGNASVIADNTEIKREDAPEQNESGTKTENVDVPTLGGPKIEEIGVRYEILWILVILAFIAGGFTMFLFTYFRKRYSRDD
ncbi:MAG: hypothetical protein Q4E47_02585 [Candidatus Saccharibacteria bacterium]|nr:hypothetical protein [Candidatus Saccharibacteria bacterium]